MCTVIIIVIIIDFFFFHLQTYLVGDSCDASGEYTTEDDDQSEKRSSCDQTLTIIGSSQDDGIDTSPLNGEPKVMPCPMTMGQISTK